MSGTTLCPHCNTRFKITEAQLEAHQGMVRCGQCMQAFDARPGYIPDQPSPQLELPIQDECATPDSTGDMPATALRDDLLDFHSLTPIPDETPARPMTLAEQIAIVQDEAPHDDRPSSSRNWPWAIAASLLLSALLAQAVYLFRVDLAARLPALKPILTGYCQLLGCSMPLPQKSGMMSIESSNLEADATHENQIVLNALLRNSAPFRQAFPHLELTLNDTLDAPLARRIFTPKDYLPPAEDERSGMPANHEVNIRLRLHTADLRPTGYRLMLFYPRQ